MNTGLYNRQFHQSEYDKAKQRAKTVAKELGISEQEAEGRIVAEILRNSDKQTADASGGKHDWEVRSIVGCQNLNCNGSKNDPNYANHDYNSQYIVPNQAAYDAGQKYIGSGLTYDGLVTKNIQNDPVGSTLAGTGLMGLGLVTGGPLATTGMMSAGAALGLGINGGVQLLGNQPFDWSSFGLAGFTGAASTGMRFTPALFINTGGALASSTFNGQDPNGAMAGAAAGTALGYPIGAKLESRLDSVFNPWYRQEWRDIGMGISTYVPKNTLPSWLGGAVGGAVQEKFGGAIQNKADGIEKK
jgi:filamentous hemagglutinin